MPICLSGHLDDATACSPPRSTAVNQSGIAAEAAATKAGGGQYADLTDLFCTADRCPVIVGNTLVYMDVSHLTFEYSRLLAPVIGRWSTARSPTADRNCRILEAPRMRLSARIEPTPINASSIMLTRTASVRSLVSSTGNRRFDCRQHPCSSLAGQDSLGPHSRAVWSRRATTSP